MTHVGEQVRRLREEKGWTQPRLSVETGLAVSGISQIENGRRNPNSATLAKLSAALGVEVADLFPKSEAPLPLEEVEQRRSPFVEAWPFLDAWWQYMHRRADEWERTLDRLEESGTEDPFKLVDSSELVWTEFTMLFEVINEAIEAYREPIELTYGHAILLHKAILRLSRIMDRWHEASAAVFAANAATIARVLQAGLSEEETEKRLQEPKKVIRLFEKSEKEAERAARKRQKVVALLAEQRSA